MREIEKREMKMEERGEKRRKRERRKKEAGEERRRRGEGGIGWREKTEEEVGEDEAGKRKRGKARLWIRGA